MKRAFALLFIWVVAVSFLQAQTVVNLNSTTNGTTQNGCAFDFYDSGAGGGNYSNNENYSITFNTNDATYTHVKISFSTFSVDNSDTLYIYDGPNTSSPLIGKYNNSNPLTGSSNTAQASLSNVSGDLTFRLLTNGSGTASGWFASTVCVKNCQQVLCAVDTLVMNPLPNDSMYVDICPGDVITFAALGAGPGAFPQDGVLYDQDSSTSVYTWTFGDGDVMNGRVVDHSYDVPNGYNVTLSVVDVNGCVSSMPLALRVRISSNPIVDIKPLPDICVGDSIDLLVGTNASSTIEVNPASSSMMVTELYDSTTFIPDGPSCPPGYYDTPVSFSTFPSGSTIQSAADVVSVCINIEHSFAGDLGFAIFCPNGQNVVMDVNNHGSGAFLGIPNESDGSPTCSSSANPAGSGWTYCWSEGYDATTILNTIQTTVSTVDSTHIASNTGYILPENSFTGLIGCPLNGTWSIRVTDDYGIDNGYVFYWTLTLSNNTSFGGWNYSVPIDSVTWAGPFIYSTSDSTAVIAPDSAGSFNYTATVWDEFGCSYDTTFTVEVLANPEPDLGNDTITCEGAVITLDAGPGTQYFWSTGAVTQTEDIESTGTYSVTVANGNGNVTCYGYDTVDVSIVPWSSVDLGPDQCVPDAPVILDAQNPGFSYLWSTGATSQVINVTSSGTYWVSVTSGTNTICSDADTVTIQIIPTANLELGADLQMCPHEYRIIDANQGSSEYIYLWSNGSTVPYITVETLPVGYYTYSVTVTGCDVSTDTIGLEVLACDLTIPNVITPGNGDGYNDVFKVTNLEYYPNSVLMVFNRWGKKVYENSNYQNDWDGEDFAAGTYFYILKVNFGNEVYEEYHGTITILRD